MVSLHMYLAKRTSQEMDECHFKNDGAAFTWPTNLQDRGREKNIPQVTTHLSVFKIKALSKVVVDIWYEKRRDGHGWTAF